MAHQDHLQIPQGIESQARFADSGASHHITSNNFNLQYIQSCTGPNKVIVGNEHSLEVKSIWNSHV